MKIKFAIKKIKNKMKPYIRLPNIWVLLIVTVLAVIMCLLSVFYKDTDTFTSSICANIFTGLLTGVTVCLITTIKSISLYRTECIIEWLNDLNKECLKFIEMYRKIILTKSSDFKDNEELFYYIYDTLCCGNGICQTISQGQFKETLPFNTYKYCKKSFSFDALEIMKTNKELHENIIELDISSMSKTDIIKLFKPMEHQIFTLNRYILSKICELNAKKKTINISIG